jgi:serine/threonine-protein kinase HipA
LAELVEVAVGQYGLIPLKDGSLAYIVRRFDRLADGRKVRQEDFCQLSELSPKDKYDSSAERCAKLLHKYATEPLIEILKFYRLLVFTWWSGNGDMHLKNFSLLVDENGFVRLTPAYDLLCTRLVITDDQLALPVCGKKDNLRRNLWLEFAKYCQLSERSAARVLRQQADALPEALDLINRSFLPDEMKTSYRQLVEERSQLLLLN